MSCSNDDELGATGMGSLRPQQRKCDSACFHGSLSSSTGSEVVIVGWTAAVSTITAPAAGAC